MADLSPQMQEAIDRNQSTNEDYSPTEKDIQYPGREGPLGPLYQNEYDPVAISYPRDLGKLGKGHSVQFNIKNIKPSGIVEKVVEGVTNFASSATRDLTEVTNAEDKTAAATEKAKKYKENVENATTGLYTQLEQTGATGAVNLIGEGYKKFASAMTQESYDGTLTTIRLYMPDSLSFNYNAQYDKLSLADALAAVPIVGKIPTKAMSILSNNALKYAGGKLGYTFNPQQQMLFEGIEFREFEMQFVFTPTSAKEAETVRQIIKTFRTAAAPTRNLAAAGFFFTPPSVFNISFFFNQEYNKFITPIRPCVLQNVTVDFAPSGWSAMRDGSPMQTSLSLSFKEIELVDRASIDNEWK